MKKIKYFRYEILLVFLLSVLLVIWVIELPSENELSFRILGTIADAFAMIYILRKLYCKKWKKVVVQGMQKIFSSVAKVFLRFSESWNLSKNKNVISGEMKIQFMNLERNSEKKKKELRWKQLKTDREKLRYLYRQMISYRIKHGARIYSSHTPTEIEGLSENTATESKVFDSYIAYRYDERKEPLEEDVLAMKETMEFSVK